MQIRSFALLVATVFAVAACQDTVGTDPNTDLAPQASVSGGDAVPGQWIVVFHERVSDAPGLARQLVAAHGGTLRYTYQHALRGFSAELSDQAVEALGRNPNVAYIEPNRLGGIVATQNGATWGLDRIDQEDLPLSTTYTYTPTGAGVNAYILDTGVRLSHTDFGGRAAYIPNGQNGDFVNDRHGSRNGAEDCHGHGTHVAGTVGGTTWGVAKGVTILAGRVVDCRGSGSVDMAIAGVDWITASGQQPAVVNMSLGYGDVQSLREAVEGSIAKGFVYAVAAGNGSFFGTPLDACKESPAGAPNALTVGATSSTDTEASWSNYGKCVDLLAPGVSITSASHKDDVSSTTMSGTSMAAPHVAGVAALYFQDNPGATPGAVATALTGNALKNKIKLHSASTSGGTPNLLLYMAFLNNGKTPGDDTDSGSFTLTATGYKVKGVQHAELTWSASGVTSIDVYRDGIEVATTSDNPYHDNIGAKGGGSYTYHVCAAGGTTTCSSPVVVTF
jgi:subtilisin family serine protease